MRALCHELTTTAPGTAVHLEGWVHRRRELARVTFLVLRDRSGLAQVVLPAGTAVPPEETTVRVTGTATANAQAPGGVEVTEARVEALTERVDEVGPVFRAEPHDTVRHLAEYRSLDVELGFVRDHRDVLAVLREVLAGMVATVADHGAAVTRSGARLPVVPAEIPVIHFSEALELVGAPADEPDLAPEHERALGAWALAEHGSDFLAVEGYPLRKRPFYTHPWSGDGAGAPP